ncbi:MAG: hypothetical protein ACERKD_05945 [Prolixibacteraceae bacterium]
MKNKYNIFIILLLLPLLSLAQPNIDSIFVGDHYLSLQWISWDYYGISTISNADKDGLYKIEGKQKSTVNDDYLKISGTLKPVNSRHLIFTGTIETCINFINNGNACVREGEFNFMVHGKRQYWRLQENLNPCDTVGVADYVDIFIAVK